jgi:hypothetical protein
VTRLDVALAVGLLTVLLFVYGDREAVPVHPGGER